MVLHASGNSELARTLAFGTLIVNNLSFIVQATSESQTIWRTLRRPSRTLAAVTLSTVAGMLLLILVPAIRDRAHFAPISIGEALAVCLVGLVSVFWIEPFRLWTAWGRAFGALSRP